MGSSGNKVNLGTIGNYFEDIRSFSVIVFMLSLMAAALLNTEAGFNQISEILAFFGLSYLIIGIAAQLKRIREQK